jgi:hypothetical protein
MARAIYNIRGIGGKGYYEKIGPDVEFPNSSTTSPPAKDESRQLQEDIFV